MTIQVDNALPPNVVEIGNEITQGVVDGLMSASPSPSSSNPFVTNQNLNGYLNANNEDQLYYLNESSSYIGSTGLSFFDYPYTLSFNAFDGLVLPPAGIQFSDNSVQTTAAVSPDLTGYLTKADNLASVASASSARTNLGLAYATDAQVIAGTSASTVLTPAQSQYGMIDWANAGIAIATQVATGTVTSHNWGSRCQLTATASGQYAIAYPSNGSVNTFTTTGTSYSDCNFSKRIKVYGRIYVNPTANQNYYYAWGRSNNTPSTIGSPAVKGFGIRIQGTGAVELQVHNGSALANVTSSFTPTTNTTFDCLIDSIGDGNVNLYINGSLVATSSAGATGTQSGFPLLIQEVSSTGTSAAGAIFVAGRAIYMA